jgi:hypothetical protein
MTWPTPGCISNVAVGSSRGIGVFVAVGGNQITVRVGVWDGAGVSVGVGGISVGGEQAVSVPMAKRKITKVKMANR